MIMGRKNKKNESNYIVEGEYKNYKFSGKVQQKNENGEYTDKIYLNGKLWTGMKSEGYDYYCSPKEDDGLFIGEYLNGRKWKGKGKELYPEKSVYFEGEYDKGKKIKGKEFYEIGNLKFEGEYLDGKYYNGKGYNIYGGNTYEIKEGKNIPEDFYDFGFKYEGE